MPRLTVTDVQRAEHSISGVKGYRQDGSHALLPQDVVGRRIVIEPAVVQKVGGLHGLSCADSCDRLYRSHDRCKSRRSVTDAGFELQDLCALIEQHHEGDVRGQQLCGVAHGRTQDRRLVSRAQQVGCGGVQEAVADSGAGEEGFGPGDARHVFGLHGSPHGSPQRPAFNRDVFDPASHIAFVHYDLRILAGSHLRATRRPRSM